MHLIITKMIVIVFGLPGSGKSYFAEHLAKILKAKHLNSDKIRKDVDFDGNYSISSKIKVYHVLLGEVMLGVKKGERIVLDATFYKASLRDLFVENCTKLDHKIHFIEIQAEQTIILERLNKKRKYSDADFPIYEKIRSEFEPFKAPHLILQSTNDNLELMLKTSLEWLIQDGLTL